MGQRLAISCAVNFFSCADIYNFLRSRLKFSAQPFEIFCAGKYFFCAAIFLFVGNIETFCETKRKTDY